MAGKKSETKAAAAVEEREVLESAAPEKVVDMHEVEAVIRKRVYAALGVGLVPVPLVDLAALAAIQLELIHALSDAYGVEFRKEWGKSLLSALCGSVLTVVSVPVLSSLVKVVPVVGQTAGVATLGLTGGAMTYAVGWVFERHFRAGGTLRDFDAKEASSYFKTKFKEGKQEAAKASSKGAGEEAGTAAAG